MRSISLYALIVTSVAAAPASASLARAAGDEPRPEASQRESLPAHVPGEIIVKLRDAGDATELVRLGRPSASRRPGLAGVFGRFGLSARGRAFGRSRHPSLSRIVKIASKRLARDPLQTSALLEALRRQPEVEYAHLNTILTAQWLPDDPYLVSSAAWGQAFPDLWGLHKINAPEAWDVSRGAGVTVAVVDSGIDTAHPDLASNVWTNPGECGLDTEGRDKRTNGVDDDLNGFADDWRGWDLVGGDSDPADEYGHGTHVAGTVAAVADNGIGVAGVAPHAKVMNVRVMGAWGTGTVEDISAGIVYAAANGARVINLSLAGRGETPQVLIDAVAYAHDAKDVVVVAAAGNGYGNVFDGPYPFYPANLRDVVTVTATDHDDRLAEFSCTGYKVDVAAPGGGGTEPEGAYEPFRSILSLSASGAAASFTGSGQLAIGSQYLRQAGTSMAAPHVSGVAALLRSQRPGLSAEEVRQAIRAGAVDVALEGVDTDTGYGRLDAAVSLAITPLQVRLVPPPPSLPNGVLSTIRGTAAGQGLVGWTLDYSRYFSGNRITIASSATPVVDGDLASWDLSTLPEREYWLYLRAEDAEGHFFEDRVSTTIDNIVLTYPRPANSGAVGPVIPESAVGSEPIVVRGTIAPYGLLGYSFQITGRRSGLLADAQVSLPSNGQQPVVDGVLGTWDTTGVAPDHYTLCVVVTSLSGVVEECSEFVVDRAIRPGWPLDLWTLKPACATLEDHLLAADLDGDGKSELLVAYAEYVAAFDDTGALLPGWPQRMDTHSARIQYGPAVGDLTGDGLPEVVAQSSQGIVHVWQADGTPLPGWPRLVSASLGHLTIADLDQDGRSEIVVSDATDEAPMLRVYRADGTSLPGWPQATAQGRLAVGDVDGDGHPEIVVGAQEPPGEVSVYRADGTLMTGWPQTINSDLPDGDSAAIFPTLADLDDDGALEIVANASNGKVYVFRADSSLLEGWPRDVATVPSRAHAPAIGDVDGDGALDVVVGSERLDGGTDAYVAAWHADGSPLSGWPVHPTGYGRAAGFGAPALADLDGQPGAEVIIAASSVSEGSFPLHAYDRNGDAVAGFPRPVVGAKTPPENSAALADLDGDGLLEMAWVSNFAYLFVWDLEAPASPAGPWPMVRHDAAHTGALPASRLRLNLAVQSQFGGSGRVTVTPPGAACANPGVGSALCHYLYDRGASVTLAVDADASSRFAGWSGACTGSALTCQLTMAQVENVTAVIAGNRAPTADAGPDQAVELGAAVTLDGAGTDPDGDALAFAWRDGAGTLLGTTPSITFNPPRGTLELTLTVTDERGGTASDSAVITVLDTTSPLVAVTSPTTGLVVPSGRPFTISWSAFDVGGFASFDVAYSTDGGATFTAVPGCTGLPGTARSCDWASPGPATSQGRARVTARDASGNLGVATSAPFSIVEGLLSLTSPHSAARWAIGSTQTIAWSHNLGAGSTVAIELSRDGGLTWSVLHPSVSNATATSGSWAWVVTGPPAKKAARVRVSWTVDSGVGDTSDTSFTIR